MYYLRILGSIIPLSPLQLLTRHVPTLIPLVKAPKSRVNRWYIFPWAESALRILPLLSQILPWEAKAAKIPQVTWRATYIQTVCTPVLLFPNPWPTHLVKALIPPAHLLGTSKTVVLICVHSPEEGRVLLQKGT